MTQEELKQQAAEAALRHIAPDMILGIGSGSTVNCFITALAKSHITIAGAVSTSHATTTLLKQYKIPVVEFNAVDDIPLYIDGADEINPHLQLIKGGGGALTQEKIIATAAKKFICIADQSKQVKILGQFPLAIEVLPMARSFVARQLIKLGGQPVYRENFVTDNGNNILDLHNLKIMEPIKLERTLNDIPGIISNGIFALRPADMALLSTENGVISLTR